MSPWLAMPLAPYPHPFPCRKHTNVPSCSVPARSSPARARSDRSSQKERHSNQKEQYCGQKDLLLGPSKLSLILAILPHFRELRGWNPPCIRAHVTGACQAERGLSARAWASRARNMVSLFCLSLSRLAFALSLSLHVSHRVLGGIVMLQMWDRVPAGCPCLCQP